MMPNSNVYLGDTTQLTNAMHTLICHYRVDKHKLDIDDEYDKKKTPEDMDVDKIKLASSTVKAGEEKASDEASSSKARSHPATKTTSTNNEGSESPKEKASDEAAPSTDKDPAPMWPQDFIKILPDGTTCRSFSKSIPYCYEPNKTVRNCPYCTVGPDHLYEHEPMQSLGPFDEQQENTSYAFVIKGSTDGLRQMHHLVRNQDSQLADFNRSFAQSTTGSHPR